MHRPRAAARRENSQQDLRLNPVATQAAFMHGRFSRISRFDLETFLLNVLIYFSFSAKLAEETPRPNIYTRVCAFVFYKIFRKNSFSSRSIFFTIFFTISFYFSRPFVPFLLVNPIIVGVDVTAPFQIDDVESTLLNAKKFQARTRRKNRLGIRTEALAIARKCDIPYARSRARYLRISVCVAVPCVGRVVVARGQQGDTVRIRGHLVALRNGHVRCARARARISSTLREIRALPCSE